MRLRTTKEIQNKAATLKKKLDGKAVYENFGEEENRELDEYIGSIWDYDYSDRMLIASYQKQFFEWRINYTGNNVSPKSVLDIRG